MHHSPLKFMWKMWKKCGKHVENMWTTCETCGKHVESMWNMWKTCGNPFRKKCGNPLGKHVENMWESFGKQCGKHVEKHVENHFPTHHETEKSFHLKTSKHSPGSGIRGSRFFSGLCFMPAESLGPGVECGCRENHSRAGIMHISCQYPMIR